MLVMFGTFSALGLMFCVRYNSRFLQEKEHRKESLCVVNYCRISHSMCTRKNNLGQLWPDKMQQYDCSTITLNFSLIINSSSENEHNIYVKTYPEDTYLWFNYAVCDYSDITCYYDDRNISATLSLDVHDSHAGPMTGIVFLALATFIIPFILFVVCMMDLVSRLYAPIEEYDSNTSDEIVTL